MSALEKKVHTLEELNQKINTLTEGTFSFVGSVFPEEVNFQFPYTAQHDAKTRGALVSLTHALNKFEAAEITEIAKNPRSEQFETVVNALGSVLWSKLAKFTTNAVEKGNGSFPDLIEMIVKFQVIIDLAENPENLNSQRVYILPLIVSFYKMPYLHEPHASATFAQRKYLALNHKCEGFIDLLQATNVPLEVQIALALQIMFVSLDPRDEKLFSPDLWFMLSKVAYAELIDQPARPTWVYINTYADLLKVLSENHRYRILQLSQEKLEIAINMFHWVSNFGVVVNNHDLAGDYAMNVIIAANVSDKDLPHGLFEYYLNYFKDGTYRKSLYGIKDIVVASSNRGDMEQFAHYLKVLMTSAQKILTPGLYYEFTRELIELAKEREWNNALPYLQARNAEATQALFPHAVKS